MDGASEVAASCAMTLPPAALTARTPSDPSPSPPVNTTATAFGPNAAVGRLEQRLGRPADGVGFGRGRQGQGAVGVDDDVPAGRGHEDPAGGKAVALLGLHDAQGGAAGED